LMFMGKNKYKYNIENNQNIKKIYFLFIENYIFNN